MILDQNQKWLGCFPGDHFLFLTRLSLQSVPEYQEQLVPYLMKRGIFDAIEMEILVRQDLFHIAHAFSVLFEQDSLILLQNMMGVYFSLMKGYRVHIDHVGRELYGPLSFYLPVLKRMAPKLGLIHLNDVQFPSTQVVKILQQQDPFLQGVTIARSYFQNVDHGKIRCLELFQTSLQDGLLPQKIETSKERLSLLTEPCSHSMLTPIDHLSLELNTVEDVQCIHDRIYDLSSETLMPYQEKISYNPEDGSTQTKVLMRNSRATSFNKIIEFVYYER